MGTGLSDTPPRSKQEVPAGIKKPKSNRLMLRNNPLLLSHMSQNDHSCSAIVFLYLLADMIFFIVQVI